MEQKSKKNKVEHEGGEFLPEDITREILSRLSVKSLLRYRSVSRHWKSLIFDNSFKHLHRQKTINKNNPPLMLVLQYYSDQNSYILTTFNLYGKLIQEWNLPILSSTLHLLMLPFPSQSKMVCFLNNERIYLCNPSTRRLLRLCDPPFDYLSYKNIYSCGFAYKPSKDEYIILHMLKIKSNINRWTCKMLTVSISNDDDQLHYYPWRSVDDSTIVNLRFCYKFGIFVCEAFYWMMFDIVARKYVILSFNVENEVFSFIGMPKDFDLRSFHRSLLEIKEKLYFMTSSYRPQTLKLWMLSDVKNQLWTQSLSINLQSFPHWHDELFELIVTIYRREYLKDYKETYETISRNMEYPGVIILGQEIHTNIFSL